MLELIKQPWHWSIAGILIGLTVPVLLLIGNKKFGVSSTLRHICAMCIPAKIPFFNYDWKQEIWNLFFVFGIFIGGFLATQFLTNPNDIQVAESTKELLNSWGISDFSNLLPKEVFSFDQIFTIRGFLFMIVGGFLVGFGTRYAGGCTSGHAISGLSNLQLPSLFATISFMIGGILSSNFILPLIFKYF